MSAHCRASSILPSSIKAIDFARYVEQSDRIDFFLVIIRTVHIVNGSLNMGQALQITRSIVQVGGSVPFIVRPVPAVIIPNIATMTVE